MGILALPLALLGGELAEAINEFLETKAIWVELEGATRDPFVIG